MNSDQMMPDAIDDDIITKDSDEEDDSEPAHPIALAINQALHQYRDLEALAGSVVPLTAVLQKHMWDAALDVLKNNNLNEENSNVDIEVTKIAEINEAHILLERLSNSNLPKTLQTSLFLGLFSSFDAFSGNLIQAIYRRKPELLESFNTEIPLSDLLRFSSFDELKDSVLEDEIEKFRRKSYVEQFQHLEGRFKVELRKFEHWSQFVEISQRRNLITHCEGVVSKQYLKICSENNFSVDKDTATGSKLEVLPDYFQMACSTLYEVSIKLGQTLWRKIFPEEYDQADEHLSATIYEALQFERWDRAIMLSHFASSVQKNIRDADKRVGIINHAIALKFSGEEQSCCKLLDNEDWSASCLDFRLAVAVLKDQFEEAARIMKIIGKKGDFVSLENYRVWPLFRNFRQSEHFLRAYEQIYGSSFASEVVDAANKVEEQRGSIIPQELDNQVEVDADNKKVQISLESLKHLLG